MHFLAGVCVGLLSVWSYCFVAKRSLGSVTSVRVLAVSLLGALSIGCIWELFEYSQDITWNAIGNYPLDTMKDLTMDLAGAYVGYVYVISRGFHKKLK